MTRNFALSISLALGTGCSGTETNHQADSEHRRDEPTTVDEEELNNTPGAILHTGSQTVERQSDLGITQGAPRCEGPASYRVTFDVTWTEDKFPDEYPMAGPEIAPHNAAHLSPLIGAYHGALWAPWRARCNR